MEKVPKALTEASALSDGSRSRLRSGNPAPSRPTMNASSECVVEWAILRRGLVNGLIVGAPHLAAAAVARIDKSVRQPVVWWTPDLTPDVPELTAGTLVIRDVDRLDAGQQERLSRWIGVHRPRVQVLGLATAPVFTHVLDGQFSAELYYRINTVLIEMRAAADLPNPSSCW